jgi:serine/threonine protein kinase
LVHNDIHPGNIVLDENETAILIDFDGSDVVGGTPKKTGTLGWHSLRRRVSFNSDYYSLALVSRWLRGKYDDKNQPIENPSEDAILDGILNDPNFQLYTCGPNGLSSCFWTDKFASFTVLKDFDVEDRQVAVE